jgi:lipopolysaccharide heptosyltransferase II
MNSDLTHEDRRILISRLKFIGDIVLTTAAVRSVRESFPGAYIAYLGDRTGVSLLEGNPHLNEIIPFDFSRLAMLEQTRVALLLRRRRFDLVIDLYGNPRSALLTFLSGARVRVGPDRRGRGRLYTIRVKDDGKPKSAIAFHGQYLQAAGVRAAGTRTEIFLSADERQQGERELAKVLGLSREELTRTPVVALHPGATWPAKKWPAERFSDLALRIRTRLGAHVVLTAGPREAEDIHAVRSDSLPSLPVLKALPLRSLAAALAACSVYVSNDAGPMHIAAALGTPTIGLFGPGEENIWFPYSPSDGHVALRKDVSCHPCHLKVCNRPGDGYMECMQRLTVAEVFGQIERLLGQARTFRPR